MALEESSFIKFYFLDKGRYDGILVDNLIFCRF